MKQKSSYYHSETVIKQTHWKPQKRHEFKLTQPKETFSFEQTVSLGRDSRCMIGLTNVKVHSSFSNITEKNDKFDLCTKFFD